jgi:hypothetical protein
MKQRTFSRIQNGKSDNAPQPIAEADQSRGINGFVPSPDEVARKAYFSYVNEGAPYGRDVQHWLAAEQELIAERNLTRTHGFHNKT